MGIQDVFPIGSIDPFNGGVLSRANRLYVLQAYAIFANPSIIFREINSGP